MADASRFYTGLVVPSVNGTRKLVTLAMPNEWRTQFGGLVRYQPKLLTFAGNNLGGSSEADTTVHDYLPNAAGPAPGGAATRCNMFGNFALGGNVIHMDEASDRGQNTRDADAPPDDGRLRRDARRQRPARRHDRAVRRDAAGQRRHRRHGPGHGDDAAERPDADVRRPGRDRVDHVPRRERAVDGGDHRRRARRRTRRRSRSSRRSRPCQGSCFPKEGALGSRVQFDVPVTTDSNGNAVVKVALDRLIGVYQDGSTAALNPFRWVAATLPGGAGVPDYAPDFGGQGTGQCSSNTGITVDAAKMARFDLDLPGANLTAPTASRGVPVTLTASGGATYRFDTNATGTFDAATASATRQATYGAATTARAVAISAGGTHQMATLLVTPKPNGTISPKNASYTLSCPEPNGAVTPTFTGSDPNSTIASRSWQITRVGRRLHAHQRVGHDVQPDAHPDRHVHRDADGHRLRRRHRPDARQPHVHGRQPRRRRAPTRRRPRSWPRPTRRRAARSSPSAR